MGKTVYSPWPNEAQRLLLRAAITDGPAAVAAFDEWQGTVDLDAEIGWDSVRLLPLAYGNLRRLGCDHPRMGLLKGVYRRVWSETNQLFHRTSPAVQALAAAGIPVMLLKGAPIALDYYRNLSLRAMSDLDICVPADRVHAADRVLEGCGWERQESLERMLRHRHAVEYCHGSGAKIDLHWRVIKEAPHEEADGIFWRDSEALNFLGTRVRHLSPGHALLLTVVHGLRPNDDPPIRWITDSLVLLSERGPAVRWTPLAEVARQLRVLQRFALGIVFLADHYGAPIPDEELGRFRAVRPSLLERVETWALLDSGPERSAARKWADSFARYLRQTTDQNPLRLPAGYLAYRYRATSSREIVGAVGRAVVRRLPVATRGIAEP